MKKRLDTCAQGLVRLVPDKGLLSWVEHFYTNRSAMKIELELSSR